MKNIAILFTLVVLCACESNYGDVAVRDKVQVYYLEPISKKQAEALADYWINKNLVGENMQNVQLSKTGEVIQLKLIANDSTLLQEIPFELQIPLFQLDSMLRKDMFHNQEFQLLISDKQFDKTKAL